MLIQLTVMILILVLAAFGYWIYLVMRRHKHFSDKAGKIRAEIITQTGRRVRAWVPYDWKACWLKLDGIELIPVNPPKSLHGESDIKGIKDVLGSGLYFLDESAIIKDWWPHDTGLKKRIESIEVSCVIWQEGISEPISNRRLGNILRAALEEFNKPNREEEARDLGIIGTPGTLTCIVDQSGMQIAAVLQEQILEAQNAVNTMAKKWVHPILIYGIGVIALIGLGATVFYVMSVRDKLDLIIKSLGVGG